MNNKFEDELEDERPSTPKEKFIAFLILILFLTVMEIWLVSAMQLIDMAYNPNIKWLAYLSALEYISFIFNKNLKQMIVRHTIWNILNCSLIYHYDFKAFEEMNGSIFHWGNIILDLLGK